MKDTRKNEQDSSDIKIYGKAKMKHVNVIKSSEVEVNQFSNVKHDKIHEYIRINVPYEMQEGEEYHDAIVASKRGVSIKISN
ncbi:hypothetical protein [Sporocytophaga myxococcoides]|uniref:hypothetical protein n=1 Tax=Sporocytophaga myxococcoides TaxID=153721 RepID=UPI00048EE89A|nr:hypothetical protein [Sporocytophaga myxococcoides]